MNKQLDELQIIQKYKEVAMRMLRLSFPGLASEELNDALDYSIVKRMKNGDAVIDNNYKKKKVNITVLELCEYIIRREPIITARGVMFKKHAEVKNPIAKLLETFMEGRNAYKKEMFKYPKGSEEFEKYNLLQLLAKIDANGFYGATGNFSCIYFNLYVAASVTTQGQSCISAAALQFEMFLSNNVKFRSLNEVLTFIDNVCQEKPERKYNDNLILDRNITMPEAFNKVMTTCGFDYIPTEEDMIVVWEVMSGLKQEDINRLYYKNNLYDFVDNVSMTNAIVAMLQGLNAPYLDPNKVAKEIKVEQDIFCEIIMEYVYYHHQIIDRIDRYTNMVRNVCIITDTDSSIISLDAWYRFILQKVIDVPMKIKTELFNPVEFIDEDEFGDRELIKPVEFIDQPTDYDFYSDEVIEMEKLINPIQMIPQESLKYSIVNLLCYCLGNIINDYMERYTMNTHSWSPDRKCLMIMKNEFLFKRVLVMQDAKKHYASIQEVQEGNVIKGGNLDIKGLEMTKSSANARTQKRMKEIMYENVLNAPEVDVISVLKELAKFEKEIFESLSQGHKDFYKPVRIKSMNSYENPMRVFGIKQSLAWNALKDNGLSAIDLEARNSMNIVKVNITPKNVEMIKDEFPETYNKMISLMQQDAFCTGIEGIAIPRDVEVTPEWITRFIDYTSIINDNIKLFPIEPLGLYRGSSNNNYTNIVTI